MKYVAGLCEYIRKELRLLSEQTITKKSVRLQVCCKSVGGKSTGVNANKGENKEEGESSEKEEFGCSNCKQTGHEMDKCWEKYPHLKSERTKGRQL